MNLRTLCVRHTPLKKVAELALPLLKWVQGLGFRVQELGFRV